jgi:uncharacterized protein
VRLELKGQQPVAAPIQEVWARLMDHEFVASCALGVESVEITDDTHFVVVAELGLGSAKLRFVLHVELSDVEAPTHARLAVRGDSPGSVARTACSATLVPLAAESTRLDWTLAADLHGTIASVGARMLDGTVSRITTAFWKRFAQPGKLGAKKKKGRRRVTVTAPRSASPPDSPIDAPPSAAAPPAVSD